MNKRDRNEWLKKVKGLASNDTPYLAVSLDSIDRQLNLFGDEFPECQIYYAVKSMGEQQVLRHIAPKVDGFDIASLGEGEQAIRAGASPDSLLFSNPVKKPEHIEKLYKIGVNYFAFDSINELTKLAQIAPGSSVYLRIKVYDHGSAFPLSSKFGAAPSHIVALMDTALELGLQPKGITFHVGSQSESLHAWDEALEICGNAMKRLQKIGIKLEFVNLGGGFPVRYTEKVPPLKEIVSKIRSGIKDYFPYEVRLMAEPGRFISAKSGLMVATVIGREHRADSEWLFTDVGTFHGLMESLEIANWKYPIFTEYDTSEVNGQIRLFTITGPTCDPSDTYAFKVPLPGNINTGDKIYIGNTGAYTTVYSSSFNGFDAPEVLYIDE